MNIRDYSKILRESLDSSSEFQESLEIARANCNGRMWLIGGAVYRRLVRELYGVGIPEKDFDYVVETPTKEFKLPEGWELKINTWGNPKFTGTSVIDLVPLVSIASRGSKKLEPTIENALVTTPLTVHSIAYDFQTQLLVGNIGFRAIRDRTVAVNDAEQMEVFARVYNINVEDHIKKRAEELGFTPVLP